MYVVTLAESLKQNGHEVFVSSCGGELVERLDRENIPHIKIDIDTKFELNPKVMAGICGLRGPVRKNSIEIIHTNTRVTQVMGKALSLMTAARHVSTCHGFFKPRAPRVLFGCWGMRVIAISGAVRDHLKNDFNIAESRIALIHNGIDAEAFKKEFSDAEKKAIKNLLGLKLGGPVIGIIARLSSVKGHKFLITAMKKVISEIKNAQLLIIGEGDEEPGLRQLVKELGLEDSVVFSKSVSDTTGPLSVMDIFVLPSLEEGLGLVLLEALCMARPVIASNVGGINSIIKDNITGKLVPPKDPETIARSIMDFLKDREKAARLGRKGQEFVSRNFALSDMVRKVETVYKQVIG